MKKLVLAALVALSFAASAAVSKFDVPFAPDDDIKAAVSTSGGWVEVYKLELEQAKDPKDAKEKEAVATRNKEKVDAAVKVLVDKKKPEGLVTLAVDGGIFFSQEGAASRLKETGMTVKRKGADVEYDDNCKVVPRAGDVLETTYRSDDGVDELVLRTTVREHHAYGIVGEKDTEPTELKLSKKEHCAAVIDSRILGLGTLTLKHNGRTSWRESVLVQYIAQP